MSQKERSSGKPLPPALKDGGHTVNEAADGLFDLLEEGGLDRFEQEEEESQSGREDPDEPEDEEEEEESEESPETEESEEEFEEEEEELGEDEEETDEDEDAETYTVKVAGEDVSVTLDELQSGYSRQSDYTQKTQKLAEERTALEAELAQTREARNQYGQQLESLKQLLDSATPAEPDWERLKRENPEEYSTRYTDWQRNEESKRLVASEQQRVADEATAEQSKALAAHMADQKVKIAEAIPEWTDDETGQQEKQRLANYLHNTYGYSKEELGQVIDHRVLVVARKAMLYDELTTKGKEEVAGKRKGGKKKVLKPGQPKPKKKGSRKSRKRVEVARKRLRKSGSIDAAADVLLGMEETEV